jgi:hypothetical protein
LCPSFDHGDCLGSKLSLGERTDDLEDYRLTESCWWQTAEINCRSETIEITTLEAFNNACQIKPIAARSWQQRLAAITSTQIEEIFDRIPEGRVTPTAAKFAINLLEYNRTKILNLDLALIEALAQSDVEAVTSQEAESNLVIDYGNDLMILDSNWTDETDSIEEGYELG